MPTILTVINEHLRLFKITIEHTVYIKIISTIYVSNTVQLFDSLFNSPPWGNYNSACSLRSFIHLVRPVKLIKKQ